MDAVFAKDVDDFHDVHRFRNINRFVDAFFYNNGQRRRFLMANIFIILLKDFTDRYHADEVIQRPPPDRKIIVIEGHQFIHHRRFRVFHVEPIDLGPVSHDVADVHIGQAKDAGDQLRFFFFKSPEFDALL